jgi:heme a synthase
MRRGSQYLGPVRERSGPWFPTLAYTLFVILFGAVVRVTGSGAGCGQHWPTCHGEIAHLPTSVETAIELTHRITSGLSLVVALGAFVLTWRRYGRRHLSTRAGLWSIAFLLVEALVGAALVLLELVGNDASWLRAVVMAFHLTNTSLLTLSMLVAAWAFGRDASELRRGDRAQRTVLWAGAAGIVVVLGSGAVTALGDTVMPLAQRGVVEAASQEGAHFLDQLRGVHPVVAVLVAVLLLWTSDRLGPGRARTLLPWAVGAQVLAGLANVVLSAPGWMQIVHLALANLVWLVFCWVALDTLGGAAKRGTE